MDNLNILLLIMPAYIIGFPKPPMLLDHINALCMVVHIQPVPDIFPVSVYRQLLSMEGVVDDQRNQFLRELIRAVIVGTVGSVSRKMIGIDIGLHQKVGASLACGIRAVRRIGRRLVKIPSVLLKGTVHLVGGHMQKTPVLLKTAIRQFPRRFRAV